MTLREWLFKNKVTVKDFAQSIGVDRTYLYLLFSGKRNPPGYVIDEIQRATGIRFKNKDFLDKR